MFGAGFKVELPAFCRKQWLTRASTIWDRHHLSEKNQRSSWVTDLKDSPAKKCQVYYWNDKRLLVSRGCTSDCQTWKLKQEYMKKICCPQYQTSLSEWSSGLIRCFSSTLSLVKQTPMTKAACLLNSQLKHLHVFSWIAMNDFLKFLSVISPYLLYTCSLTPELRWACAQPPACCDFLPCPSHVSTDISGGPWAAPEPVTITGHGHCPHWAWGNRAPTVQHCLASWDISAPGSAIPSLSLQDHCGYVSSGRVCVTVRVSTEGFSQCTPNSADRTVLIPPCQNWHHYQLWWFLTSDSFQNQIRSNKSLALAGINQN